MLKEKLLEDLKKSMKEKNEIRKNAIQMVRAAILQVEKDNAITIEDDKIIVIYDDIDLDVGTIKLRKKGGAGTHNGMKSVISYLDTDEFVHIRIGTGKPVFKELLISHVLEKLTDEEYNKLTPAIEKASKATEEVIKNGIDIAMNKFNI